jgi:hypothetical protein
MAAGNLTNANANRSIPSSYLRRIILLGVIGTTAWTLRTSLREFDGGGYNTSYSVSLSTTTTRQAFTDLWLPAVLEDNAPSTATSASTKAQRNQTTSIAIATTSTALVFNKTKSRNTRPQSSSPRNVHLKHNLTHTAVAATPSMTNVKTNVKAKVKTSTTNDKSDDPPRPHPHAGARDADGNWGYVADVTRVRRLMVQRYRDETAGLESSLTSSTEDAEELMPPSSYIPMTVNETAKICSIEPGKGIEGKYGWGVVIKVELDGPNPLPLSDSEYRPTGPEPSNRTSAPPTYRITTPEPNGVSKGKILCGIYTYDKMDYRIQGISETWGWRCDGFLPVSTVTIDDPAVRAYGSVDVPHHGKEAYDNMWQKTRSILAYMFDNYYDDYDYFYLSGDDTHLIVENLRRYLYTVEQSHNVSTEPLYMGMPYKYRGVLYNSGGAGYVLNRVALKQLVVDAFPKCFAKAKVSAEDRFVAMCLLSLNIDPLHTVDAQGRQRFLGMSPNFIGRFKGTNGVFNKMYGAAWGRKYGWRTGHDIVSEQSIAFHMFRSHFLMKRHHAIIYNSCSLGTVLGDAVQKARDARANAAVAVVARR